MKKTTAIISALMFGSLLAGSVLPAAAAEVTNAKKDSYGIIEFKKEKNPNPEKPDPENPGEPGEKPGPNEPEGPQEGNDGPLKILFASNFDFGEQTISSSAKTAFAALTPWSLENKEESTPTPNFVQVEDLRPGKDNAGWKLSVQQTRDFTMYEEGVKPSDKGSEDKVKDTLTGLKMSLHGVEVFGKQEDGKKATIAEKDINISDESTPVMSSEIGKGIGRSSAVFAEGSSEEKKGDIGVKLEIPQGTNAYEGKYYATIEWALTDAP